jgi:uncharacterized protein (DUF2236 family)
MASCRRLLDGLIKCNFFGIEAGMGPGKMMSARQMMLMPWEKVKPVSSRLQTTWPQPLSARQWDQRFPGILDGIHLLAGAANVILQLARRPVGYGIIESIVDSGNLHKHPVKRTRTTITYLAVALLGTSPEKLAYREAVNRSHAQVKSGARSKVEYNAFDPELQLWVAASLYWGSADTRSKFNAELPPEQQEALYQLCQSLGTTLQVRENMWPENLDAFNDYWETGLKQLQLDDTTRHFLTGIAGLDFLPWKLDVVLKTFGLFTTAGFLPAELRAKMRFDWDAIKQKRFDKMIRLLATINRRLPRTIRQWPFLAMMWDFRRRLRKGRPLV